jgi:hypothetical protein
MPATLEKKPMAKKPQAVEMELTTTAIVEVQLGELPPGYVPQYVGMALDDYEGRVMKMINAYDNENDVRVCEGGDHVGDKLSRSLKRIIRNIGLAAGIK